MDNENELQDNESINQNSINSSRNLFMQQMNNAVNNTSDDNNEEESSWGGVLTGNVKSRNVKNQKRTSFANIPAVPFDNVDTSPSSVGKYLYFSKKKKKKYIYIYIYIKNNIYIYFKNY